MEPKDIQKLRRLNSFEALVDYLRDELDWPIEAENTERVSFNYDPQELGIDPLHAVKIESIRQVRPLTENQPWGVFYVEFESKQLPVVVLRRILQSLVPASRSHDPNRPAWKMSDLLFISSQGQANNRSISFAHFRQDAQGKHELRTFSWEVSETHLYYIKNLNLEALRWPANPADSAAWRGQWASAFTVTHRYVPTTAQMLAGEMARLARQIRETVLEIYNLEHSGGPLHQVHLSLKMTLITDLEADDFADMYAQTITYGLFAARATRQGEFLVNADETAALIAHTNPFLRELLSQLMDQESVDLEGLGVSELTDLLKQVDMEAILQDFGRQKRGEDPVIHFYETFMKQYDPVQKTRRGEFYTPDPVVSFIVRSVDYLLKTEFGYEDGLADTGTMMWKGQEVPRVQILDPATGTGTFLKYVIEVIWEWFYNKHKNQSAAQREKRWNEYVHEHLLPRLYGFELKMAPYTIAHMKLGLALKATSGFEFEEGERLRVYLSNALQPAHEVPRVDTPALAHEVQQANEVKSNVPINIVIGNPPYAVTSSNIGEWITSQVRQFYYPHDEIKEHNPKMLLDDYVKFLRLGQFYVTKNTSGILALITNHGYLDNVTFRGMRQQLMQTFDEIYIIDLHGNSKKREIAPDGSKDENVFDIQQGVAICFFVKRPQTSPMIKKTNDLTACIFHANLFGSRIYKYEWLMSVHKDIKSIDWTQISPQKPFYLYIPQENAYLQDEYFQGWKVTDVFPISSTGIKTHRDHFVIDMDLDPLEKRIEKFKDLSVSDFEISSSYQIHDTRDWKLTLRRRSLAANEKWRQNFTKILFRTFDIREIYYSSDVIELPRSEVMRQMVSGMNLGLCTNRQVNAEFNHIFCTKLIIETCTLSMATSEASYLFPLYCFPSSQIQLSLGSVGFNNRIPNLSKKFISSISMTLGIDFIFDGTGNLINSFGPDNVFHYIYAFLHSPSYRQRYAEFLKMDFPRIPLTSNLELFRELCGLGKELVGLHLLESPRAADPRWPQPVYFIGDEPSYPVAAGYPKFEYNNVMINPSEGFKNVPNDVWEFHIGGYQVCYKWLKDRRGRQLSAEDIAHYKKIVHALGETIEIMGQIDEAIEAAGGWPIR